MDDREYRKRKERSDLIWTFIIIGAFITAWPIGIVLAILRGKGILPDFGMGIPTSKEPWRNGTTNQTHAQQAEYWAQQAKQQAERSAQRAAQWAVPTQKEQREIAKQRAENEKRARKLRFGKGKFITGLSIGGVGLLTLLTEMSEVTSLRAFLADGGFALLGLFGVGLYLAISGFLRMRQSKRLQEYGTIIDPLQSYYSIHELADRTGRPYRQVITDLQKMIELGVWERAWIDRKHGRLMFTEYSAEQVTAQTKAKPVADDRAEHVLQRIRTSNDLIEDAEISRKIDRIELLTGQIFRYLAKYPEREGELRTFMDYYLPQTLKILETYARLEAQGVETDNIRKAKAEISGMLDQLTESYERQLDKLFDTDVLDISSDIEVMRQMLRNDGLAADELAMEFEKR